MYFQNDEFFNPDPFEKAYDDLFYALNAGGLNDYEANHRIDAFIEVILKDRKNVNSTQLN